MAAGLISDRHFQQCAVKLVEKAKEIGDAWSINQHGGRDYLCKRVTKQVATTDGDRAAGSGRHEETEDRLEIEELVEEPDGACVRDASGEHGSYQTLMFEYHILHSDSYSVPVMYFNVHSPDGRLLPLTEVWDLIPAAYQKRLQEDRWTFLTQQEHPYLGRPFFQLHPCHTEALMSCVESMGQHSKTNYLVSWLSVIGPVVLLDVPLAYGEVTAEESQNCDTSADVT